MTFKEYPNRMPGVGTIEDIKNISLEDLKLLYQMFYHPKNSFVVVTGNVNPREVIRWIKENQDKKKFPKYQNPVLKKYREHRKELENPIITTIFIKKIFLNI